MRTYVLARVAGAVADSVLVRRDCFVVAISPGTLTGVAVRERVAGFLISVLELLNAHKKYYCQSALNLIRCALHPKQSCIYYTNMISDAIP